MTNTYHIMTFGCQMNFNDSDWLKRNLNQRGFEETSLDKATIIIVNTCSVREKPEQKVYATLNRIRVESRPNPDAFVVVAGCVAQQLGTEFFDKFEQVRIVSGTDGLHAVPLAIDQVLQDAQCKISLIDFSTTYPERELGLLQAKAPAVAYVNIMQGCDNFCAYCIVPFTRGRQKSRSTKAILEECQTLVQHGTQEICLLGQNVNAFGQDKAGDGTSFAELLYHMAEIKGLQRLRFMTPHPKDFRADTIKAFADIEILCPHIHLPMQAGSNKILQAMKRKYTRQDFLKLVQDLRNIRENISFSTDIIVGFPGEDEDDFLQTCSLVQEVNFRASFSFCYSDRPGTSASRQPLKIPQEVQLKRLGVLQDLQEEIGQAWLNKRIGDKTTVLLENKSKKDMDATHNQEWWQGKDPHGVTINLLINSSIAKSGILIPANIVTAKRHTLIGEVIGNV